MKAPKLEILEAAKAAGLFKLARRRTARGIRVLCYHGLWTGDDVFPGDAMFMQKRTFERRLEIIRREGYPVVSLTAAVEGLMGRGPALPPAAVVITIDDGWFSSYDGMLPALQRRGMPATLYCDTAQLAAGRPIAHVLARYLGRIANKTSPERLAAKPDAMAANAARKIATDLTRPYDERLAATRQLATALGLDIAPYLARRAFGYMTIDELNDAAMRGLEVELHTHRHTLGDMSRAVIEDEIGRNRDSLAAMLGRPVLSFQHFCYPSGVATADAAAVLASLNLTSSTTTEQGLAWPGQPLHLLPRLLDGENLSEIEFEAELSGFGDWLRRGKRATQGLVGGRRGAPGAAVVPIQNVAQNV